MGSQMSRANSTDRANRASSTSHATQASSTGHAFQASSTGQAARASSRGPAKPSKPLDATTTAASVDDDLSSYEAACQADPRLCSFDSSIQRQTTRAIHSIVTVGIEVQSLVIAMESLLEMNGEALKLFLQDKRELLNNPELSDLVEDYFKTSLSTLDFCNSLDTCLRSAGRIESLINVVIQKFEDERRRHHHHQEISNSQSQNKYSETLKELKRLSLVDDPFGEEFFRCFHSIYDLQVKMFERLQVKKRKLDAESEKVKIWRRAINAIFVVTFATVLICSVVAAAASAPPVVTALAGAASVPLGSMGGWLNSIWKMRDMDLKGQKGIVGGMQKWTYITVKDLDGIKVLVEKLRNEIEALVTNAEFGCCVTRDDDDDDNESMLAVTVEEIKTKLKGLVKTVRELNEHANKCRDDTRMARTLILREILNFEPSN